MGKERSQKNRHCVGYNILKYISTTPGSDWSDLPNKVLNLSEGKMSKKLHYFYEDKKMEGARLEVSNECALAGGKKMRY